MHWFPRFVTLGAVLALGITLVPLSGSQPAQAQPESPEVPGELLVKFRPGTRGQDVADAHRSQQAQVNASIKGIDVDVVKVPPGQEKAAADGYRRNPNVQFVEANRTYEAITHGSTYPQDPQFDSQWQYRNTGQTGGTTDADIDAYEAWNTAGIKGSSSIKVAVLDTGIDPSHEDLTVSKVRNFTTDLNTSDLYGHGTHVAGSVAAKTNNGVGVSGTCPQCTLWNYKVLNNQGSGQWDWIANGIIGAADDGAHVISMSLGGYSPSQTLQAAVDYAWGSNWSSTPSTRQHAVVVAAAGNDGQNWGLYPAAYTNSIAVGATDSRDARASFSNFGGNWVDVAAPGASILSTAPKSASSIWPSGTTGYGTISGTSMATPHVSGLAGLVWSTSLCGAQDNACVRNRIESTADKIAGTGSGTSDFTTFGRINAYAAVVGSSSSLPTPTSTSIATLTPTPTQTSTPTIGPSPTSTATPPSVPAIDVTSISPSSMTAGGQPITVTIVGTGIQNGATVTFEQGSGNTPVASNVSVASDGKSLTARVSAGSGGPPRPRVWNVRVTNPGGASDVLTGAFTVNR